MSDNELMALIKKYFPASEWANAFRVMKGESGGNPGAVGDNYPINGVLAPSVGLFQIRTLPGRPSAQQLKDPEFNVQYAANLWKQQGWNPWTVARKLGIVKQAIKQATPTPTPAQGGFGFVKTAHAQAPQQQYVSTPAPMSVASPTNQRTHVVKPGDTLWGIAQQYLGSGAKWGELGGYEGDPRKMPVGTRITY